MDSEKIQSLFAQTLVGGYESEEAWAAASALRMDGNREIFEYAAASCRSDVPGKESPCSGYPVPASARKPSANAIRPRMDVPR
jgi:hypothetical protein